MMAKLPPCRGCERDDCSCPICNRSGVAQHRGFTTPCHHCAGILTRSLREQLSAATARASELEKEQVDRHEDLAEALGRMLMNDETGQYEASRKYGLLIEEVSQLRKAAAKRDAELSALGERVARAERENEAWRALAKWARVGDRTFFINTRGAFVASGDEEVNGKTASSAIDLATKLGLIAPDGKGEASG